MPSLTSSILCSCPSHSSGLPQKVQALVDDAVAKGAKVLTGGQLPQREGQFYPPTVLLGVRRGMKIWEEEVFGPVSEGAMTGGGRPVKSSPRSSWGT